MRILLDENLPHDLGKMLAGLEAMTVAGRGWAGVHNGVLLQLASGECEAFLTMDRRLPTQQRVTDLPFAVILLVAPSNRLDHLRPLIPSLLRTLSTAGPGTLHIVGE